MIILNDYNYFSVWLRYYLLKYSPSRFYKALIKYFYKNEYGIELSYNNPLRLSEKLNILKLKNNDFKSFLSDRLNSKKYVLENLKGLNCLKVYQVANSFDELDFDKLPKTFLLKTNHACKTGILVKDKDKLTKEQINKYRKYYKKVLSINYAFWGTLELQYKNVKPVIYAEEYLEHDENSLFKEYEVYCINGVPEFIQYTVNNDVSFDVSFLNSDWEKADFDLFVSRKKFYAPDSKNLYNIINYSKELSKEFEFVRVDFFEKDDILYFAEVTFTPFMGNIKFVPEKYDFIMGDKLKI